MRLAIGVDGGGTGTTCVVIGDDDDEHLGRCGELRDRSANANSVGFESAPRGAGRDRRRPRRRAERHAVEKEDVTLGVDDATAGRRALAVVCAGIDGDGDVTRLRNAPSRARARARAQTRRGQRRGGRAGERNGGCHAGYRARGGDRHRRVRGGFQRRTDDVRDQSTERRKRRGVRARAGGWGPAFEDRGSGHHLGHQGAPPRRRGWRTAGVRPRRCTGTSFVNLSSHPAHRTPRTRCARWAYSSGPAPEWSKVADLAPLVTAAAAEGDAVAVGIVNDAAEGLWEQIFAVYMAIKRGGGFGSGRRRGRLVKGGQAVLGRGHRADRAVRGFVGRDGVLTKKLGGVADGEGVRQDRDVQRPSGAPGGWPEWAPRMAQETHGPLRACDASAS